VLVVLGAATAEATALVPVDTDILVVENWGDGMGESLRQALATATGDAVLVTLVDLPDLPLAVVQRVLREPVDVSSLAQAVFEGRPGHPVLIGRSHWAAVCATLAGDHGARGYLVDNRVTEVECDDLWDGHDVDRLT